MSALFGICFIKRIFYVCDYLYLYRSVYIIVYPSSLCLTLSHIRPRAQHTQTKFFIQFSCRHAYKQLHQSNWYGITGRWQWYTQWHYINCLCITYLSHALNFLLKKNSHDKQSSKETYHANSISINLLLCKTFQNSTNRLLSKTRIKKNKK